MTMQPHSPDDRLRRPARRYVREPVPVHFPSEKEVPETKEHLLLRTALFQMLRLAFADAAWIGSDQFVYWDPTDPGKRLAPDVMLRRGGPDDNFPIWKVWERGAPELAIEIVSPSDQPERELEAKLDRYDRAGVTQIVRFDRESKSPLRVWDRVQGDLVERDLLGALSAECEILGHYWIVVDVPDDGRTLRLSRDPEGKQLFPTPEESRAQSEQLRAKAEQGRADAERERDALAERVRALEAKLRDADE